MFFTFCIFYARGSVINGTKFLKDFFELLFFFVAIFLTISLFSYSATDPSLNLQAGSLYQVKNSAGSAGANVAGFLVDLFGLGSFFCPLAFFWLSGALFWIRLRCPFWRLLSGFILYASLLAWFSYPFISENIVIGEVTGGGGFIGTWLLRVLFYYLHFWGATILLTFLTLLFSQIFFGFTWGGAILKVYVELKNIFLKYKSRYARYINMKKDEEKAVFSGLYRVFGHGNERRQSIEDESEKQKTQQVSPFKIEIKTVDTQEQSLGKKSFWEQGKKTNEIAGSFGIMQFPSIDLLNLVTENIFTADKKYLQELAEKVQECLQDFNIQGKVNNIVPGPVVTMFEFKPAPGIKISKIAGLSDDLALALRAQAVRIVAPLPRKDTVGIEIPNEKRQTVFLREIFDSPDFNREKMEIPLALGKNIQGDQVVVDLARMPHLLVAGATGAGKSVCLNGLILSMLYTFSPNELKLLLVDPKRVELAVYRDLPHLVHPVVTDMGLTKNALDWAVQEMERRYDAMANLGVRNFRDYNEKLASFGDNPPEEFADEQPLPYLVIIIDELADLMMTAAKEAEISIARLGQLARASGIHLILATQRPSVDVVTGLIKANLPSRIAFQVSSKHDSRTILDTVGAEYLLGRGDMLYKQSGGNLLRAHGAFVGDEEIRAVVKFWKEQAAPEYLVDFQELQNETFLNEGGGGGDVLDDPKYNEALDFVIGSGKASISMIQRRLRIGFNRAARFIEQMEEDGIVGPQEGSKPRTVLRK